MQFLLWLVVFFLVLREEYRMKRPIPESIVFALTIGIVVMVVINVIFAEIVAGLLSVPWWGWLVLILGGILYLGYTFFILPRKPPPKIFP